MVLIKKMNYLLKILEVLKNKKFNAKYVSVSNNTDPDTKNLQMKNLAM